jgi:hypothetical protein
MSYKPCAVERAFQIADSGKVATVKEIGYRLSQEGYSRYDIMGLALSRQLGQRIRKAKADAPTA